MDDFNDALSVPGMEVVGLQEIDWDIKPHHLPKCWKSYQPESNTAKKDPIVWNADRLHMIDHGSLKVLDSIREGEKITPRRHVNWVVFKQFIWLNFHLNADVEGRPGQPKNNKRPQGNYLMLNKIIELADTLQETYNLPVFISADMNVDFGADRRVRHTLFPYFNLTKAGFKCCWEGRREESTRRKNPIKGRTIDQVWVRGSKNHKVKFRNAWTPNRWSKGDRVESDHLAVVVTAVIRRRIAPWLFNKRGQRV